MKVWYNKIHDSRRTMVEIADPVIKIGRDPSNTIVLQSPLVSKRHAIVSQQNGKLRLENVGINGCMVGETEVLGGESLEFTPGQQVRIWPYSLTFEAEVASVITRAQLEAHLRSIMADLELRIHKQRRNPFAVCGFELRLSVWQFVRTSNPPHEDAPLRGHDPEKRQPVFGLIKLEQ